MNPVEHWGLRRLGVAIGFLRLLLAFGVLIAWGSVIGCSSKTDRARILALAGVDATRAAEIAGRELPGKDLTGPLSDPRSAKAHDVRDAVLFTYSGIATNDGDMIGFIADALAAGKDPKAEMGV